MTIQLLGKELETWFLNGKKLEEVWHNGMKVRPSGWMELKHFYDFNDFSELDSFTKKRLDTWGYYVENSYAFIYNANNSSIGELRPAIPNNSSFMVRARYKLHYRSKSEYPSYIFWFKVKRQRLDNFYLYVSENISSSFFKEGTILFHLPMGISHLILEWWVKDGKIWYAGYADQPNDQITEETPKLFYKEWVPWFPVDQFILGLNADYYWRERSRIDRVALYE